MKCKHQKKYSIHFEQGCSHAIFYYRYVRIPALSMSHTTMTNDQPMPIEDLKINFNIIDNVFVLDNGDVISIDELSSFEHSIFGQFLHLDEA